MTLQVVILAAGQGKRMHSSKPKILHLLAGKPLLEHVILTAMQLAHSKPIIIHGHQGDLVREQLAHHDATWVEQKTQLGTGHALLQALPLLETSDRVLVLYGDVPLISVDTLKQFVKAVPEHALGIITTTLTNPFGYGRIKRNDRQAVINIVEEKEATIIERTISEVNSGIYLIPVAKLQQWLPTLKNNNTQQEYYLTDVIRLATEEHVPIQTMHLTNPEEMSGVNDRQQLAVLERFYQRQLAEKLMQQGVTIVDPNRIDIRGDIDVEHDVTIDINVIFEGDVKIGKGSFIGANSVICNTTIGENVDIKSHSVIEGADIKSHCVIGPFARIRPQTTLSTHVHIGNFVEIKNSAIHENSKVNHLSYLGDSEVGKQVNIGAGTITCNYDGANKHKTTIGDDVHIGSDTQLVAPVTIGAHATIGAGSTVTKDVPESALIVTHQLNQRVIKGWQRPKRAKAPK